MYVGRVAGINTISDCGGSGRVEASEERQSCLNEFCLTSEKRSNEPWEQILSIWRRHIFRRGLVCRIARRNHKSCSSCK